MNRKHIGIIAITLLIIPMIPAVATNTSMIDEPIEQAPTKPLINGPIKAKYGEICNYTAVSTDPQGEPLIYVIEYSDAPRSVNERGPYQSGQKIELTHVWNDFYQEDNPYKVRVKAIDTEGHESEWSRFITHIEGKNRNIKQSNLKVLALFEIMIDYLDNFEIKKDNVKNLLRHSLIQK